MRRLGPVAMVLGLLALAVPAVPGTAVAATDDGAASTSRTVVRQFADAAGDLQNQGSTYHLKVAVDHTENLRGRERVHITWSGARPSAARAGDPFGDKGVNQEYPMVIMQCRGTAATITPETCWTTSARQRAVTNVSRLDAGWVHDPLNTEAQRTKIYGMSEAAAKDCTNVAQTGNFYARVVPFRAASGKVYSACDQGHMPPEAAADGAFPANDVAAFTKTDGTGDIQFEVRTDVENESLGCSDKVDCAIVMVPIVGLSCDNRMSDPGGAVSATEPPALKACKADGLYEPGSTNFAGNGVPLAVGARLWWSPSVWKNRVVIPVTFGTPASTCDVLDRRKPTGFYGSELLAQAALQWAPAYCLNKDRFKFQLNQMPDRQGFSLMNGGLGVAAEVSSEFPAGADPVGYAPTAVTGFGVGYIIDKPENAGEYTQLRLNARLLAKLLSESYPGPVVGPRHPGIDKNPRSIQTDPEFTALNPGLGSFTFESAATLLALSNSSGVMQQVTEYIAQDQDAMDFLHGEPDPWGTVVNPAYDMSDPKVPLEMPTSEWPLLDPWEFPDNDPVGCWHNNESPYMQNMAAPVTTLAKISTAVLDGWPNLQTRCDTVVAPAPGVPGVFKTGRVDRQGIGGRFVLGIVSLGDAERYGLTVAALKTAPKTYVAPTRTSMAAALELMKQSSQFGAFTLDQAAVKKSKTAYPGTMVVYTATKLQGLAAADVAKVSQFIRVASTEGQKAGSGNGQLPDGFLPILKTGATARFYASAQAVAKEMVTRLQGSGAPTKPATVTKPTAIAPGLGITVPDAVPTTDLAAPSAVPPTTAQTVPTAAITSSAGRGALPLLLGVALLALLGTGVGRLLALQGRR